MRKVITDDQSMPANNTAKYDSAPPELWRLIRIGAASENLLLQATDAARRRLRRGVWPSTDLSDTRGARLAFPACDPVDALRTLGKVVSSAPASSEPVTAFLFPGLGGEAVGRLASLLPLDTASEDIFLQADKVLNEYLGLKICDLVSSYPSDDASSQSLSQLLRPTAAHNGSIKRSVETHALLFTLECALATVWLGWGIKPSYVCGYSLGEYAAACVAGVFDFSDGLTLLLERAILLDSLPPTAMLAAARPIPEQDRLGTYVVAENASDELIYGGELDAIQALEARLHTQGIIARRLAVEHAFHTPLLRSVQTALAEKASIIRMQAPNIPIISTVTGNRLSNTEAQDPSHWARHLCKPVLFQDALQRLTEFGAEICLEVGPGQALTVLTESSSRLLKAPLAIASMPSDFDTRSAGRHLIDATAKLWMSGSPLGEVPPIIMRKSSSSPTAAKVSSKNKKLVQNIVSIWSAVLMRQTVSPDDNLFDIGGNSLRIAQIIVRLRRELNVELTVRDLLNAPTPRHLAQIIADADIGLLNTNLLSLPNGLQIRYQSRAEALYFYRSIFDEQCYLRHGITIPEKGIVIDAGANIGMFSIFAALAEPSLKLFSCEPIPALFDMLKFNLNDLTESAIFYNAGLARNSGEAQITFYPESSGMSSFLPSVPEEREILINILTNSRAAGDVEAAEVLEGVEDYLALKLASETFQVPLITVSQIIREHHLTVVDLLKVDVQKFELEVLMGITDDHWSKIRQVVVEVHDIEDCVNHVIQLLTEKEFEVHIEQDHLYKGTNIFNVFAKRIN